MSNLISTIDKTRPSWTKWIFLLLVLAALPVVGQPSLQEVLEHSLDQSQAVKIGEAERDKARFDRHTVYQTYLPNVSLESSFRSLDEKIRFRMDPLTLPMPGTNGMDVQLPPITLQDRNTFRASIEVSQVLFTGFRVSRLGQAARYGESAAEHKIDVEEQELLQEVMAAYDQLALVDQALAVVAKAEERLAEEQRIAEGAYKEGLIPAYDLNRLKIAERDLEKERIEWEGKRELAARNLEHLSGVSWQAFQDEVYDLELLSLDPGSVSGRDRPEVKALKDAGQAAHHQYRAAKSDYMPNVYAFFRQELYEDDLSVLEPARVMGVGLQWDLFDGFNRSRNVQRAERDRIIARERLDEVESLVELDRQRAELSVSVTMQKLEVSKEKLNDAETGLRLSTERYRLGLAPVSEKLEAETDYRRAEMEWLEAVYEQRRAVVELLRSTGVMDIEHIVMLEQQETGG